MQSLPHVLPGISFLKLLKFATTMTQNDFHANCQQIVAGLQISINCCNELLVGMSDYTKDEHMRPFLLLILSFRKRMENELTRAQIRLHNANQLYLNTVTKQQQHEK